MKKVIKIFLFGFMLVSLFSCAQASGGDDNNTVGDSGSVGKTEKSYPYGIYYLTINNEKLYYTLIKGGYNASKKSDNGINYSAWVGDCKFDDNYVYITKNGNSSNVGKYAYSTSASGDRLYLTGYPKEGGQICEILESEISPDYNEVGQVLTLHKYTETGSTGSDTGDNGGGNGGSSVSASDFENITWNYTSSNHAVTATFANGTLTLAGSGKDGYTASYSFSNNKVTINYNNHGNGIEGTFKVSIADNKLTLNVDGGNAQTLLSTFFGGGDGEKIVFTK